MVVIRPTLKLGDRRPIPLRPAPAAMPANRELRVPPRVGRWIVLRA